LHLPHPDTAGGAGVPQAGRPLHAMRANIAISVCAVAIFGVVSLASGKLDALEGLGWDGFIYARMLTGELADGSPNARMRPFVVLLARIPYEAGLGIRESFVVLNAVFAFGLYLTAAALLQRCGVTMPARAVIVTNLALSIATSKMFAFYPTQVDLGALAFTTLAFYLASSDRHRAAGAASMLAAASREFGIAVSLYGIHRTIRQRRPWSETALYVPALVTFGLIRLWSSTRPTGDPLSSSDALQNLVLWASPAFVGAFAYFAVTVFGGLSTILAVRPRWCLDRLREEPELATFLVVVVGLTVAGSLDIWRYLVFGLPAALVLFGRFCHEQYTERLRALMVLTTCCTLLTQRPFESMDAARYFRDWFPLYHAFGVHPASADFVPVWTVRVLSLLLLMVAVGAAVRARPQTSATPAALVGVASS
jgi:hypothetical protein